LELIDKLQRDNVESETHIEDRQRAREADPLAYDDHLREESLVTKHAADDEVLYRRYEPPPATPEYVDKDFLTAALGEVIVLMHRERTAEVRRLKTELAELRGKLNGVLTMLGQSKEFKSAAVVDLPNWRERNAS
jgi:hypothetical protein